MQLVRHICVRMDLDPTPAVTVDGREITATSATWTCEIHPDTQEATLKTALATDDGHAAVAIRVVPLTDWPKWPSRRPQPPAHIEQSARWAMLAATKESE